MNKGLNIRPKTINPLEKNIQENLHSFGFGNGVLDRMPKA